MSTNSKINIASGIFAVGLFVISIFLDVRNGYLDWSQFSLVNVLNFLLMTLVLFTGVRSILERAEVKRRRRIELSNSSPEDNRRQFFKIIGGIALLLIIKHYVPVIEVKLEQILSNACIAYHQQHGDFPPSENKLAWRAKVPSIFFKYNTVFPTEPGRCDLLVFDSLRYVSVQPTVSGQYQVTKQVLPIEQLLPSRYQDQS